MTMKRGRSSLLVVALAGGCGGNDGGMTDGGGSSTGTTATSSDTGETTVVDPTEDVDTGSSSTSGEAQHPAVAAFWAAFLAEDYGALDQVSADLDAAAAEMSDDPEVVLSAALAHLWRLAEFERDPDQGLSVQIGSSMAALAGLKAAKALAPEDPRIPCYLGLLMIDTGEAIGDQQMAAQGHAEIDAAIEGFPEFSLFCRMLEYGDAPRDSPEFQQAVDAMWTSLDLCYPMVDPSLPDVSSYLDQQTDQGIKRVCWNLVPKAMHNWEGYFLHAGDIIAKTGDVEVATVLYENAMLLDWDSWLHQDLIDQRLADVAARADSYQDADPANDAAVGSGRYSCTMCHGGST
ncbi:MAG TPA: hypothetical protein VGB85_26045 [Nannocystis sp.]|jgi:hypothetical protein